MYNNSFYGGQKGADIKLVHAFPHLSADNGHGLLDDLSAGFTSNINLGDYVIVAYGKEGNDLYETNAQKDGSMNWNSSIWEKVFVEKLLPNEIYAKPNILGWNYKLITQFTNKYDNALSVKYSYDFYTYSIEGEFNSGVKDTLEAVKEKLHPIHGGQKIDEYFSFEEIDEREPEKGKYYMILDGFTLNDDTRSKYFPENTGWTNGTYSSNIVVTKDDKENAYQNVTSSFKPIHSNQVIAVNHYYEDDGDVSTSIGQYKSYWYFQRPDGEWGRVLITGDLSRVIQNKKYTQNDANLKVYSAEYVNNNLPIIHNFNLISSNWKEAENKKNQNIEIIHSLYKTICLIFQPQQNEHVAYNYLEAEIDEGQTTEEKTVIKFTIPKNIETTDNLSLKAYII